MEKLNMEGLKTMFSKMQHALMDVDVLVVVLKVLAFYFGIILGMTGVYFLAVSPDFAESTETYANMAELFPIEFYGLAFVVSGVVLLVSISSYPLTFFMVNAIGSTIGGFCFMVYSAASYNPVFEWYDQILAWRYGFVSIILFSMGITGVLVWMNGIMVQHQRKRKQKREMDI